MQHNPNAYHAIRPRSRVTIVSPHGNLLTGTAVMRGPAGWVLNLGGRYGTPGIATSENTVAVKVSREKKGSIAA